MQNDDQHKNVEMVKKVLADTNQMMEQAKKETDIGIAKMHQAVKDLDEQSAKSQIILQKMESAKTAVELEALIDQICAINCGEQ